MMLVVVLIVLHLVDGRAVQINPAQVTQLQETRADLDPKKQMTKNIRCVVRLTDSTYVSVAEDCDTVRELMEGAGQ